MSIFKGPKVTPLPAEPAVEDEGAAAKKAKRRASLNIIPTILTSGQGLSGQANTILGG